MSKRFLSYSWEHNGYLFTLVPVIGLNKKVEGLSLEIRDTDVRRIENGEVFQKLTSELEEQIKSALPKIIEVSENYAKLGTHKLVNPTETVAESPPQTPPAAPAPAPQQTDEQAPPAS
jgi:hypothetical protein